MKRAQALSLLGISHCFSGSLDAQPWSGTLSPSQVIDWSNAGVVWGSLLDSWTQCGSTIAASAATWSTINTAIAGCGIKQYVLRGTGALNLSAGIDYAGRLNIALPGSGADQTFLVFTTSTTRLRELKMIEIRTIRNDT